MSLYRPIILNSYMRHYI